MSDEEKKVEGINYGVQMLVKRMESNPEDFDEGKGGYSRWGFITRCLNDTVDYAQEQLPYLTREELELLHAKYQTVRRELFSAAVLRVVATEESINEKQRYVELAGMGFGASGNIGVGVQATPYTNQLYNHTNPSIQVGNESINEKMIRDLKKLQNQIQNQTGQKPVPKVK